MVRGTSLPFTPTSCFPSNSTRSDPLSPSFLPSDTTQNIKIPTAGWVKKTRERELFETLRVSDHGKKAAEKGGTGDALESDFFGRKSEETRRYGKEATAAAAIAGELEGGREEEERLLRAVDNGDLDL